MEANGGDAPPTVPPIETDALIIGAGPTGLFLAFELGLLEITAHIVDSLPQPGGQCIELYPDKPIYDIPGVPYCTGRELVGNLMRQIEPFALPFHLGQEVSRLRARDDGRFDAETTSGTRFLAKTVFIAGGAGSFQPRLLKVDGIDRFSGTQLFYREPASETLAGRHIVIVGGSDEALDAAVRLAEPAAQPGPASVTLLHRRDIFDASAAHVERLHEAVGQGRMRFIAGQVIGFDVEGERLANVQVIDAEEREHRLPVDTVLAFLGVSPRLGPIANWGLALERKQVAVDTATFQTGTPGLYAVGDINTYPGKRKLILCGFHEATLAAFAAAARVFPDERVLLQYTTTSPKLHRLLGVDASTQG